MQQIWCISGVSACNFQLGLWATSTKWVPNGDMTRHKAQSLMKLSNEHVAEDRRIDLESLSGWLEKYKRRWSLLVSSWHGKSGDVDDTALAIVLSKLPESVLQYDTKDIFSADECGLSYCLAPTQTIALERVPGRKKANYRISVLLCANMDGSEKIELLFIGTSTELRAFKKKSGSELVF